MTMNLTTKNILCNLLYYTITLVAIPWGLIWLESSLLPSHNVPQELRIASLIIGSLGGFLQLWCIVIFQQRGKGTPSPFFPTSKLITTGPYRYVRNPMNIGELIVFLSLSGLFGSWLLLAYAAVAWIVFHAFILIVEEPRHFQEFGIDYEQYVRSVNRWLPVFRRMLSAHSDTFKDGLRGI
jgi:protein-S-isoprenylcysteine O-methyltransferase Ste14